MNEKNINIIRLDKLGYDYYIEDAINPTCIILVVNDYKSNKKVTLILPFVDSREEYLDEGFELAYNLLKQLKPNYSIGFETPRINESMLKFKILILDIILNGR